MLLRGIIEAASVTKAAGKQDYVSRAITVSPANERKPYGWRMTLATGLGAVWQNAVLITS
jgi:hypothetical protein